MRPNKKTRGCDDVSAIAELKKPVSQRSACILYPACSKPHWTTSLLSEMATQTEQKQQPHRPNAQGNTKTQNVVDEREVRQESAKAARQAQKAKRKAKELRDAAYGAGDPEERQKLLERAIDKEIEAESFGKTAKYLRSGTFQGMAVGTGIGVVPGLTLGTLTGTLVGGLTSLITGGLGAGVGALSGWIHGPFWNMGEVAGKGIQRITGNLPGWVATDQQKRTLEKMLGQIKEEDMPDDDELQQLGEDDGSEMVDEWSKKASDKASSWTPSWMQSKQQGSNNKGEKPATQQKQPQSNATHPTEPRTQQFAATQKAGDDLRKHMDKPQGQVPRSSNSKSSPQLRTAPQSAEKENVPPSAAKPATSTSNNRAPNNRMENSGNTENSVGGAQSAQTQARRKPRKLETRSAPQTGAAGAKQTEGEARKPRKLERRS